MNGKDFKMLIECLKDHDMYIVDDDEVVLIDNKLTIYNATDETTNVVEVRRGTVYIDGDSRF